jgi:hypothetical protein
LGCWISPSYGPLSLGARFETSEPFIGLILTTLVETLLLLLLTAIDLSPGGSSTYTSTDKTNKNKYT